MGMLGSCTKVLIEGIIKYFNYPSHTKVTVMGKDNITFPAVTICSNNRVSIIMTLIFFNI